MKSLVVIVLLSVSVLSAPVFAQNTRVNQVITHPKKVIGPNNMRSVSADMTNIPFQLRNLAESVGLMSMGCTGTHLGNGLVISAGHCFDAKQVAQYRNSCDGIKIYWGVRYGKQPSSVSNCRQVLIQELNSQRDYALFRVDNPPRTRMKIRLQGHPELGTRVTIFSHPFRDPLMWSGVCDLTRAINYGINVNMIHHRCDTNPGSSGAAIVDVNAMEIVGIHDGGIARGAAGANYGTYIDMTLIPAVLQRLGFKQ
ncbi:MAG: trypsin-like peptidase domain-containing protein [Bdellovibrionaceae bacterium]|nr:trypsin-like peptidase domain-containing protein [Pseudobdellovibrionaceae bacterium]